MRSGLVSLTTARPVNTAQPKTIVNYARPMTNVFNKAHSTIRRPINNNKTTKNSNFNKRVNTVSGKNVNTARPKAVVNAARPKAVLNDVKGNQIQVSNGLGPQKKLIQMIKIHTDKNVADLFTKAFDGKVNAARHKLLTARNKKIIITEATIKRDLQLEDADGVDCLPNATIFEHLTLMGIYVTPSHTKKVFGNMKREGKGFSRRVTPLFPTMMVQALEEMGEGSASPTDPHHTPIITQPSTSQPQKKQKPRKPKRKDTEAPQPSGPTTNVADEAFTEENVTKHSNDPMLSGEDSMKLEELMELCTNLQQRVIDLETPKTTQGSEIASLKRMVKKLEKKNKSRTHKLKRLYKGMKIDDLMFDTCVLNDEEVVVGQDMDEKEVSNADPVTIAGEVSARPKTKGVVIKEPSKSIITTTTTTTIPSKDKGKGIMVEEPLKMKKKDQISFDEQEAIRLQAEFDEEDKIETDYEMAQRLQAEEQEELTIEEKSKLFVQLLEARKKHFASKRAEEERNKPPTKAQRRSIMCTYLKNMSGWKPKDLKNKSFANIQDLFDKAMKRVNTFVDMDTELVKENDGDDVTIEATPLSTKSPTIVDYKIYKEGKKSYFQIIRAYARFKKTEPVNYMDTFLDLNLKTMFEHHLEDNVWKNQQGLVKVLNWKALNDLLWDYHWCDNADILYYMLVKKMVYTYKAHTTSDCSIDGSSQVDYELKWHLSF
ncbi:hypothetical protein Tco_1361168 [Tanacetum coccineum]